MDDLTCRIIPFIMGFEVEGLQHTNVATALFFQIKIVMEKDEPIRILTFNFFSVCGASGV